MSRVGRVTLLLLGPALLAVVAVVLLRQALLGAPMRDVAEQRLSATFGQPVSIGRLSLAFFPRVAVSGEEIQIGDPAVQAPSLAVARVLIAPRLISLFSGPVVVEAIQLDGFAVSVLRDHKGGWHVPAATPAQGQDEASGLIVERLHVANGAIRVFDELEDGTTRESASIDDIEADVSIAEGGLRLAPVTGHIDGSTIAGEARADGRAVHLRFAAEQIEDADLPAYLGLLGSERPALLQLPEPAAASIDLRVDRATARLAGSGRLRAPQVVLAPLHLEQFDAPFKIDGARLTFEPTAFRLYGGTHTGRVDIRFGAGAPRWSIDSRVTDVHVARFLTALAGADQRIEGTAAVEAAVSGRLNDRLASSITGQARLHIVDGVLHDFPLVAALNRALRLAEGDSADTRFRRLTATLALGNGRAVTDDLVVEAGHIRLRVTGRIGFDRSLDLRGTAVISAERSAQAIASIRELSGLRNPEGELEIPLTISGSADDPSIAVDLKAIIGKGMKDELMRRLRGLIRR